MISLNFLPLKDQKQEVLIYRRLQAGERKNNIFYHRFNNGESGYIDYEISFTEKDGFESYTATSGDDHNLITQAIYQRLINQLEPNVFFIKRPDKVLNKKIHFTLEDHHKGKKCIWIEPYYLPSAKTFGLLFDFTFVVDENLQSAGKFTLDKDILIASGSLNPQGYSNFDFYAFKHEKLTQFIKRFLPLISSALGKEFENRLLNLEANQLAPKNYLFGNGNVSISPYLGLLKNPPLQNIVSETSFYFIYKQDNRDVAISLLKGLRGETNPSTFSGMEKLFKVDFSNSKIKGASIENFDDATIDNEIQKIKALPGNILPIIITNSKKDEEDEMLYYWLKHKLTNAGLPCQVVTKELVRDDSSIKYSLSNIGLQIFAKSGGHPWKMKSSSNEYLIIGIGQSYNYEETQDGRKIEKNITYSVLTDSSGLFKDIRVLGEGVETDDSYYDQLVNNISKIIASSEYKKVSIHTPFRMSKKKVLDRVATKIGSEIELSVLVINSKSDFYGFDYKNNGLVPFESTYIKISSKEFLVWFEGLQNNNPKITKRFGNPILIKFWYTNQEHLFSDYNYKESLLQDCINLSGANWRGFKAKQLPVSVFYCQRIAEFISKFKQYDLPHIEINNLKPWFL